MSWLVTRLSKPNGDGDPLARMKTFRTAAEKDAKESGTQQRGKQRDSGSGGGRENGSKEPPKKKPRKEESEREKDVETPHRRFPQLHHAQPSRSSSRSRRPNRSHILVKAEPMPPDDNQVKNVTRFGTNRLEPKWQQMRIQM